MKRRRLEFPKVQNVLEDGCIRICKDDKDYFFEIDQEVTTDIGEAVAILMRNGLDTWNNKEIWNTPIENKIKTDEISPEKSLYWLTGGDDEWTSLDNYSKPWHQMALTFQEEYGMLIVMIISKAKTLGDIRDGFMKYLNLPTLYDFAVKNEMVC